MSEQADSGLSERPAWVSDAVFYQIFPDRLCMQRTPVKNRQTS